MTDGGGFFTSEELPINADATDGKSLSCLGKEKLSRCLLKFELVPENGRSRIGFHSFAKYVKFLTIKYTVSRRENHNGPEKNIDVACELAKLYPYMD